MAIKANIVIDQGTDFSTNIYLQDGDGNPLDLTGYSASAQMRRTHTSSTSYSFTVTLVPTTGELILGMTNTLTSTITAGRYVYDVEMTDTSNLVTRVVEGIVTVTPQVTR